MTNQLAINKIIIFRSKASISFWGIQRAFHYKSSPRALFNIGVAVYSAEAP